MKNRDVMKRPYQKFLFFMCDRPAVADTGDHRRQQMPCGQAPAIQRRLHEGGQTEVHERHQEDGWA